MASAGTRLFSFSAVVFLFYLLLHQAPVAPGLAVADHLASALDRFLDGRGLMELATRRNMILLCHAILVLILRDAGVLGAPTSRRTRTPPGESIAAPARPHPDASRSDVVALTARSAAPFRPHATRSTAAGLIVECRPVVLEREEAVVTWAAPVLTAGPPEQALEEAAAVATKQIVVVESPRNDDGLLDRRDRAAVVEPLEHPTAIAVDDDGERADCDDRRIVAVVAQEQQTAAMEMEMEMELADDKTFEEFIKRQRRTMRQESLHYHAIATCY